MIGAREKTDYYSLPQTPAQKERVSSPRQTIRWVRKERLAFTGLIFLIFCSCVIISYYYAQVFSTGYRLSKAQHELNLLRTESHDLYTKINRLSGLEYIEMVAVHKLGMVAPEKDDIVMVAVEPLAGNEAAAGPPADAAGTGEERVSNQKVGNEIINNKETNVRDGQNPVLRAFADMVERLEKSIRTS